MELNIDLVWKDIHKKLNDMGLPIEADRLQQKFQKTNAQIAPVSATFLLPRSLSEDATLDEMVDETLTFYRNLRQPIVRSEHAEIILLLYIVFFLD